MASISKKIMTVILALAAVLCLFFGASLFFKPASAEGETQQAVVLNDLAFFENTSKDGGFLITGLNQDGSKKVEGKNFSIDFTGLNVTQIGADDALASFLTSAHVGRLTGVTFSADLKKIGPYAFAGCTGLGAIDLSAATNLTEIGESAFDSKSASKVESITVPAGVTKIGALAFANHASLTKINYYAASAADFYTATGEVAVKWIDSAAPNNPFRSAGIRGNGVTVDIGRRAQGTSGEITALKVTKIPAFMFAASVNYPNKIVAVNFNNVEITKPESGESAFGAGAFGRCTYLASVSIPSEMTVVGKYAFYGCISLKNAAFVEGLDTVDTAAFAGCTALESLSLPVSLKNINSSAFSGCNALTEITVPEGVKNIGKDAFANCANIETIHYNAVNASVNVSSPFEKSGKDITVFIGNQNGTTITKIPANLFRNTNIKEVTLANANNSGGRFGDYVFENCKSLTTVTFASDCSLGNIGTNTFKGCSALTQVTLPANIETIDESVFENCSALSNIDLKGVTKIGCNAFAGCGMYRVTIPDSVTKIDAGAFKNCKKLYEVNNFFGKDLTDVFSSDVHIRTSDTDASYIIDNKDGYVWYNNTSTQSSPKKLLTYYGVDKTVDLTGSLGGSHFIIGQEAFKGNATVETITVPETVDEIEKEAFAGCASLRTLNLPEGISGIPEGMCNGCTALISINIPSTVIRIAANAFDGCSALRSVKFNKNATDGFKLTQIDMYAFNNCSSLTVVEIPESVTSMGSQAFNGCTRLTTVYLPKRLDNINSMMFGGNNDLLLIAPSSAAYATYSQQLGSYGKVSYIVTINLFNVTDGVADSTPVKVERLYGFTYDFVKQADKTWAKNGSMPVQEGYESSVWYKTVALAGAEANVYDSVALDNDLKEVGKDSINLYAYHIAKPVFTPNNTSVEYSENSSVALGDILKDFESEDKNPYIDAGKTTHRFSLEIAEYRDFSGKVFTDVTDIKNAGTYKLVVALSVPGVYGVWEVTPNITFTFTVTPHIVDLSGDNDLLWMSSGDKELESGTLYFYRDNTPYSESQTNMGDPRTVDVRNSYVIYTKGTKPVIYLAEGTYYKINSYGAGDGVELTTDGKGITVPDGYTAGKYEAEVILTATNNYRLQYPIDPANPTGVVWTERATAEGYQYVMVKTWYIATTTSNPLVIGSTMYDLPDTPNVDKEGTFKGWFFGEVEEKALARPTLSGTPDEENGNVTFRISSIEVWGDTTPVEFGYNDYKNYINGSMPAGHYMLEVSVKAIEPFAAYDLPTFEFDVKKANYENKLGEWGLLPDDPDSTPTYSIWGDLWDANVKSEFTVEYTDGGVQFADTSSVDILGLSADVIYGNRQGIWAKGKGFDSLYPKFEISYNLDGLSTYYKEKEFDNGPHIPGKYTVYFNISSPNYESFVDTSVEAERLEHFYTLYIKRMIDADTIGLGNTVYTGSAMKFDDTDFFKFVYLNGSDDDSAHAAAAFGKTDEYINAGTHTVAIMIRKDVADSYAWKAGNETVTYVDPINGDQIFAVRSFEIQKAKNESTQALSLREWTWGETANEPQWSTKFVADKKQLIFRLTSLTDVSKTYYFNPKEAGQLSFDDIHAGEYRFTATAPGGDGYNWDELTITYPHAIIIEKATLTLKTQPYMESWRYGDFETGYVGPELTFSDEFSSLHAESYIVSRAEYEKFAKGEITKAEMNWHVSVEYMLDASGEVPVGNYMMVFELAEESKLGDDYYEWRYAVPFDVIKARNYWKVTPTIHDWVYGDYSTRDTVLNYAPYYGSKNSVIFSYRDEFSGWVTDIANLGLDVNGELAVGKYDFRAYLPGTDNYEDLELILSFNVTKADNSWVDDGIPSVISWSHGRWNSTENALSAKANYGAVQFSVYAADDTERSNKLDINNLNALDVGSYVLVAFVEGTDDYNELISETTFAVFEDSVGMTGIIAATVVFAVIAIGLAVSGVVLLILRNKKIEEEFRRMIKSELRRK